MLSYDRQFKGSSEKERLELIKAFMIHKMRENRRPFVTWIELAKQSRIWFSKNKNPEGNLEAFLMNHTWSHMGDDEEDFTKDIQFIEIKFGKMYLYYFADQFKKRD